MSISPSCDACGSELTKPGALAFSPPLERTVFKYHLCVDCWGEHFVVFGDDGWTVEHPFACRLSGDMAHCAFTRAMTAFRDDGLRGRFHFVSVDGGEHGLPLIEQPPIAPIQTRGSQ